MARRPEEALRLGRAYHTAASARAEAAVRAVRRATAPYWYRARETGRIDPVTSQEMTRAAILMQRAEEVEAEAAARLASRQGDALGREGLLVVRSQARIAPAVAVELAGPASARAAVGRGIPLDEAVALGQRRMEETMRRRALDAGRGTVIRTARANRLRWRRVSDGRPCAFCAMLVSRGPVYVTDRTAGFDAHDHCGCVAELSDMTPQRWLRDAATAEERALVELYDAAAHEGRQREGVAVAPVLARGRRRDTVLHRMREMSDGLLSDGR